MFRQMAIRFLACPDSLGDIRAGFGAARQTPCFKQSSAWQAEKPAWCAFLLHVANACVRHMSAPLMSSTLRMGFLGPSSCPGAGYGCRASSSPAGAGRTAALRPSLADFGHVPEGAAAQAGIGEFAVAVRADGVARLARARPGSPGGRGSFAAPLHCRWVPVLSSGEWVAPPSQEFVAFPRVAPAVWGRALLCDWGRRSFPLDAEVFTARRRKLLEYRGVGRDGSGPKRRLRSAKKNFLIPFRL
jgi:hypothetical protein